MEKIEFMPISGQAGYGYKAGQVSQNGTDQDSRANGASLAGETSIGIGVKKEEESAYADNQRVKAGLTLLSAKANAIVGTAHDNYLRLTLNYGFRYYADVQSNDTRIVYGSGITGRFDYTNMKLDGQTVTGQTNSITLPLALGVGGRNILVSDKCEFGIGFPASFRLENQVEAGYRLYANYNNTFLESADLFANYTFALGRISDSARETSHLVTVGLRLGLVNVSPKPKEVE